MWNFERCYPLKRIHEICARMNRFAKRERYYVDFNDITHGYSIFDREWQPEEASL